MKRNETEIWDGMLSSARAWFRVFYKMRKYPLHRNAAKKELAILKDFQKSINAK